jgi:hypothetical protein
MTASAALATSSLATTSLATAQETAEGDAPVILKNFDTDAHLSDLKAIGGEMRIEHEVLHLDLAPGDGWPQLLLTPEKPLNWKGKSLAMQVKNAGDKPVEVGIRIDDDAAGDGWKHSWTDNTTLAPGEKKKIVLSLGADPMSFGMRGLPPTPGAQGATTLKGWGDKPIDASHITSMQLFVAKPKAPVQLLVDNIALIAAPDQDLTGVVDEFGQFTRAEWPTKIRDAADLKTRAEAEAKELEAHPMGEDLDKYGGWKKSPELEATGFFRTQQIDGKWWLVDPEGHLFFSSGVDVVQSANPTIITGRESMFRSVPAEGTELGQFRGEIGDVIRGPIKKGLAYDFGRANLFRKYGPQWSDQWNRTTLARLKSWGFNTVGNWSSDDLKKGEARMPYVATSGIYGDHARLTDGDDYWQKLHDPFDPTFAEDARRALAEIHDRVGEDPFCIGYFVENELSFGAGESDKPKAYFGLVYGALNSPPEQPAKKALLAHLKEKYGEIGKLNEAWGTTFDKWDAMKAPFQATETPGDAMKADFSDLLGTIADKYFSVVAAQMKKVAPHHLYLGSRFSGRPPLEVSKASAKNCDVVSFNIYSPQIDEEKWKFLKELNKPVLIGEFHIGSTDRGVWMPGLVEAKDQAQRAEMFKTYVQSVLDNPNFVGCHWFQWADEPNTGRTFDGENYNIGMVDIADTPYPELIAAAKEVNGGIYTRRLEK